MPPLPEPNRRRRNAPTIPTTKLPAAGRAGPAPRPPRTAGLGPAGKAWWRWAWGTPQAAAWDAGAAQVILRRASLEDDLAALGAVEGLDFLDVLGAERAAEVKTAIARLAALASGRLAVMREMRELDDRLGLTPKALAQLRWTIVEEPAAGETGGGRDELVARLADRRRRLADAS